MSFPSHFSHERYTHIRTTNKCYWQFLLSAGLYESCILNGSHIVPLTSSSLRGFGEDDFSFCNTSASSWKIKQKLRQYKLFLEWLLSQVTMVGHRRQWGRHCVPHFPTLIYFSEPSQCRAWGVLEASKLVHNRYKWKYILLCKYGISILYAGY